MQKIKILNNIQSKALDQLDKEKYEASVEAVEPSAIIVRSAKMHDMEFGPELLCIGRAGAGVNNIPTDRCAGEGIVVFNAPGANAEAVKELALCAMLMSARDVVGGVEWVKSVASEGDEVPALVEKQKAKYIGPEIAGKTLGIVGLGAIGAKIAKAAIALGMTVYGYDPYLSVDAAWRLSPEIIKADDLNEIYKQADFISLHVPYLGTTHHMINKESISKMKPGVRVINLARAELVCDDDMLEALGSGHVAFYVTDFPNGKTAGARGVIAIPHLGASTPESEDNCVSMVCSQIADYIENGNIRNPVNIAPAVLARTDKPRICVIHVSDADMIAKLTAAVSSCGAGIENMISASAKGSLPSYTMLDISELPGRLESAIKDIDGVIRVRVLP